MKKRNPCWTRCLALLLTLLLFVSLLPVGAMAESSDPLAGLASLGEFTPPEMIETDETSTDLFLPSPSGEGGADQGSVPDEVPPASVSVIPADSAALLPSPEEDAPAEAALLPSPSGEGGASQGPVTDEVSHADDGCLRISSADGSLTLRIDGNAETCPIGPNSQYAEGPSTALLLQAPEAEELYLDRLALEREIGWYTTDWTILNLVNSAGGRQELAGWNGAYSVTLSGPVTEKFAVYDPVFAVMTLGWNDEDKISSRSVTLLEAQPNIDRTAWSFQTSVISTLLVVIPTDRAMEQPVAFRCTPAETEVTLCPAPTAENPEPAAIDRQEDGTWSLVPGDYVYCAMAEGYKSAFAVPFTVTLQKDGSTQIVDVTLEKVSAMPAFDQSAFVDGVVISVKADEGVFPEGAVLSVQKVALDQAAENAVDAERDGNQTVAVAYTFDICVINPETGEEYQPADGQSVSVSFALAEVADENLTTNVYHVTEEEATGELSAEALDVNTEITPGTGEESTAVVETDGFSIYQVEFTYDTLQYVLPGNASVAMSEILTTLGLTGEVTAVEISNTALFSAVQDESGTWYVTAHQPFSTPEWMKVTILNQAEVTYVITVTDDQNPVSYLNANGETQTCTNYTLLTEEITTLNNEWYVVSEGVSYNDIRLEVNGDAYLILCNDAKLHANSGITVSSNNSLTIYAQSTGSSMGKLEASSVGGGNAGIGGTSGYAGGKVTINGGSITASSGDEGAGIGGGNNGAGGEVTINGGTVRASSGYGAGIGSGGYSGEGTVTINGGKVTASSTFGAGMGGGLNSNYIGSVRITGGTIEASSTNGAGIGCGKDSRMKGTVSISGGTVTASSDNAAGIGGVGNDTDTGSLTVNPNASLTASSYGGTVTVEEGYLKDNATGQCYGGTLTADQTSAIAGKTLVKATQPYTVTVNPADNGSVTPSATFAEANTTITLTVTPATGYVLDSLTYTPEGGEAQTITPENDVYSFTMPAGDVSVCAVLLPSITIIGGKSFTDISNPDGTIICCANSGDIVYLKPDYSDTNIAGHEKQYISGFEASTSSGAIAVSKHSDSSNEWDSLMVWKFTMTEEPVTVTPVYSDQIPVDIELVSRSNTDSRLRAIAAQIYRYDTNPQTGENFQGYGNGCAIRAATGTYAVNHPDLYLDFNRDQKDDVCLQFQSMASTAVTAQRLQGADSLRGSRSIVFPGMQYSPVNFIFETRYSITVNSTEYGTVTASADFAFEGDRVTLTASPAQGYRLNALNILYKDTNNVSHSISPTQDGTDQSKYSFDMPFGNVIVTASFIPINYSIGTSGIVNGTVTASVNGTNVTTAHYNDPVILTITSVIGYVLDSLTYTPEGGEAQTVTPTNNNDGTYSGTFTMPAGNVIVSATFIPIPATAPSITTQPQDLILTYGYTTGNVLTVAASAASDTTYNTLSYQWYSCSDANKTNPQAIDGATGTSYTVSTGKGAGTTEYYYCVVTATRTDNDQMATAASNVATLTINKANGPTSPTGLEGVAPTTSTSSNGKITGVTTAMEYSTNGTDYTACTGTEVTGLSTGTYYVRMKETETHEAGSAAIVSVPAFVPVASIGDVQYSTLKAALDAANNAEVEVVVNLLEDVNDGSVNCGNDTSTGYYSNSIIINLNGHTVNLKKITILSSLTITDNNVNGGKFTVAIDNINGGNPNSLTVSGNASVICTAEENEYSLQWMANTILVCDNGSLKLTGKSSIGFGNEEFSVSISGDDAAIILEDAILGNSYGISSYIENMLLQYAPTGKTIVVDEETPNNMVLKNYPAHTHSFTYGASGATITATCSAENCPLTESKATLTITAPALTTYGGTGSAAAALDGLDTFNTATGKSVATSDIQYFKATKNGDTYTKSGTASTNAPTVAGDYLAEITLSGVKTEAGQNQSVTASVGYTIGKADPGMITVTMINYTYGGTVSTPTVSANPGSGTVTYYYSTTNSNTGGTEWKNITGTTLNAGKYYLYATVGETTNYNGATTTAVEFTVERKVLDLSWSTESLTYNGKAQAPTATATDTVNNDQIGVTVTVEGEHVNVGSYTATATGLTGDKAGNYKLPEEPVDLIKRFFSIEKATVTVSGITANDKTYDGGTNATLVTTGVTFGGIISGDTLTVSGTGTFNTASVETNKTVAISNLSLGGNDANNYTLSATDNQTTATASITAKPVTISGLSASNKTYDGTTAATVTGTAVIDGRVGSDDVNVSAGSAAFTDANVGTGKTVTFSGYLLTGTAADNYTLSAQPASVTANITQKAVTVTAKAQSVEVGGSIATGTTQAELTDAVSGHTLSEVTLTGSSTANVTEDGMITPSSAKIVSGTTDVTGNYNITYKAGKLTVTKAKAQVTTAPTANNRTYNGTAANLLTGGVADTALEYSTDGTTYSTTVPQKKDANSYTVYYRAAADANHIAGDSAQMTVKISPASLTVKAKDKTITYGDAPANDGVDYEGFVNGETPGVLAGTVGYAYNYSQYGDVGNSYTITPSGLTSGNYEISFYAGTLTVEQKEVGLNWSADPLLYNGSAQAPTAMAEGLVNGDSVSVTVTGQQTNAGTGYTATASALTGDKAGNYKLPAKNTTTFSIGKAGAQTIADVTQNLVYSATSISASVAGKMPAGAGTLSYSAGTANKTGNVIVSNFAVDANGSVTAALSNGTAGDKITLPVTISSTNYADSTVNVVVTLTAKSSVVVTITEGGSLTKTYGDAAFTLTGTVTNAGTNGVWTWTSSNADVAGVTDGTATSTVTIKAASTAPVTITAKYESDTTIGTAEFALTVNPKEVSLSWASNPTYTGLSQNMTATVGNTVNNETVTVTGYTGNTGTTVGDYNAAATALSNSNYKLPANPAHAWKITKAPLTVKAKDKTITYGDAPANDGVTYSDFVNGEMESVLGGTLAYAYNYSQYGDVGNSYTITPSGLTSSNYEISYAAGTLTVEQKEVGLNWSTNSLTYNGSAQAPTAEATGLVNNDEIDVTVMVEGEHINAGNYTAIASALTGNKAGNYKLPNAKTQNFAISQKAVTVTAMAQSVEVGGSIATGTTQAELTDAVSGHTLSEVTLTGSSTANVTEDGTITPSAAKIVSGTTDVTGNYNIIYKAGKLTVTKAKAQVTTAPTANNRTYNGTAANLLTGGAADTSLEYSTDGTNYSSTVPQGTNADNYTVYYRASADSNHHRRRRCAAYRHHR